MKLVRLVCLVLGHDMARSFGPPQPDAAGNQWFEVTTFCRRRCGLRPSVKRVPRAELLDTLLGKSWRTG